jgi:hypothetical protein
VILQLHLVHCFEFSSEIWVRESLWDCYSWVVGTLDGLVAFVAFTLGLQWSCGGSPTFVVPL